MKSKHSLKVKMTLLTAKAHRDTSSTKLVSSSVFLARYQGQCLKSSPIFWAQADPSLLQVELGYDVWSRCYVFYNRDVNRLPNNQRLFLHHLPAVTLVKEDESWIAALISEVDQEKVFTSWSEEKGESFMCAARVVWDSIRASKSIL